MSSSRGHLQGALDVLLAANFGKIGGGRRLHGLVIEADGGFEGTNTEHAAQMGDDGVERFHGNDVDLLNQGCFGRVGLRHIQGFDATAGGERGHGQNAVDMAHTAIEAQFADHQALVQAV